jgi:exonuclease SbcC
MKPLVLEMQAFGPFAHRQIIDFQLLGEKTFFLIHGPTGSGKTTILDGMSFALFGDTSGGEREGRQMRSHHADSGTLTTVTFDFALGSLHYRVKRSPEQMRKALRGTGETKQAPQADMWQIDASGQEIPLATGSTDVTRKVTELLGFESKQFRQVIMLPQGKFREFLMANSQEREVILQTLFGTELYKRIEEQLKAKAAEISHQAESVRTKRQTLLQQAEIDSEEALAKRIELQSEELKQKTAEALVAQHAVAEWQKRVMDAELIAAKFKELDEATADLDKLSGTKSAWDAKEAELKLAKAAANLAPYFSSLEETETEFKRFSALGQTLAEQLPTAETGLEKALAAMNTEKARLPEIDLAVGQIKELEALSERVKSLTEIRQHHQIAENQLRTLVAQVTAENGKLKLAQDELARILETIQKLELAAATLPGAQLKLEQAQKQLDNHSALAAARHELQQIEQQVVTATEQVRTNEKLLETATSSLENTRSTWIAGQATRLAQTLSEGCPCPVCGSPEHPVPANINSTLVTDEQLRLAEVAVKEAEQALTQVRERQASEQVRMATTKEKILGIENSLGELARQPLEHFRSLLSGVQAEHQAAQLASTSLATEKDNAEKLRKSQVALESKLTAEQGRIQSMTEQVQQLAGQIKEKEAGIPDQLGTLEAVQTALGNTQTRLQTLRTAAAKAENDLQSANTLLTELRVKASSNRENLALAEKTLVSKRDEFAAQLSAQSFQDIDAFLNARKENEVLKQVEQAIRAYQDALGAAQSRLVRAKQESQSLQRSDIEALKVQRDQAVASHLELVKQTEAVTGLLKSSNDFKDSLEKLFSEFRALEETYAVMQRLSEVANGKNAQRMSFQRYVLATLLEEVLAATTQRLRIMSRGRYEMQRRKEPGSLRAAAGLDLEIFDHYTGQNRAVSTLSGGESFLASLALALGLSDVVQSYAGGIRLDAIFVDEGFGTLDPESLDFAIRALKDLQQAGRLVGIISHVAELKEWIDARLLLSSTQSGSSATFECL